MSVSTSTRSSFGVGEGGGGHRGGGVESSIIDLHDQLRELGLGQKFSYGGGGKDTDAHDITHTPEYLSWRRLHLAKSKLSNVAEMASFMAGFAVVATVELQINDADANPVLLTAFVVTTSLLVAASLLAILISTCILPHITAVAKMSVVAQVGQSPHEAMAHLVDLAWVLANTASLFFFTLDVILLCWIKFTIFSRAASIAATAIMGPVLVIILAFGLAFYRKISKHQYVISALKCQELERMKEYLDMVDSVGSHSRGTPLELPSPSSTSSERSRTLLRHQRVALLKNQGSRGSLRSRGSSADESSDQEGRMSKTRARSSGTIFIV